MQKCFTNFDENLLKSIFDENNTAFLMSIPQKASDIQEELNEIIAKKKEIEKQLAKEKKRIKKHTKEYVAGKGLFNLSYPPPGCFVVQIFEDCISFIDYIPDE